MSAPRARDWRIQLAVGLSVLVGLFFLEYPPMFMLGYWSWGATVHKTLTGAFLLLNLLIAQYVARRGPTWSRPRT